MTHAVAYWTALGLLVALILTALVTLCLAYAGVSKYVPVHIAMMVVQLSLIWFLYFKFEA